MKPTQQQRILDYINEYGYISSLDAAKMGIMDLQGNIQALEKKGYSFNKNWCDNYKKYSFQEKQTVMVL